MTELAPASEKLLTVILKTTNFCSLACDYCYVRPHASKTPSNVMSPDVVAKTIKDYTTIAEKCGGTDIDGRTVKLTWHGGEPLMAGLSYFQNVMDIERSLINSPCRTVNSITTNGTRIDEEWAGFFKEEKFQVAVSLDGPEHIHNSHRRFPNGEGSYQSVMDGIDHLRKGKVPFGVLTVVSKELVREPDVFFDFCIEHKLKNIAFIPYTTTKDWLSASDFAEFSIRFFDLWYDLDDPEFYVRDFANIMARIFGREGSLCEYKNCFGNYLCIDTNGDVYMCDLLIGNPEMYLGNVMETSLREILSSPKYHNLKNLARTNSPACDNCNFFSICTGGCMYRRYLENGNIPGKDIYCSARQRLISHILKRLEESEIKNSEPITIH